MAIDTITLQQIMLKRGDATSWSSQNPILAEGEPGFEIDSGNLKIGNGIDNWNTLPYSTSGGAITNLSDLSDVVSATNTDKFVLVANGTTGYEGRALVEADISDLQSYLTSEVNDLTASVTWANVPDVNITQSSVTQHQGALSITESQISDLQAYVTSNLYSADGSLTGARSVTTASNQLTFVGTGGNVIINSGRLGIGEEVFGGTRLGDSLLQVTSIDTTSINIKDTAQVTSLGVFSVPVGGSDGYTTTMKNFVDDVHVVSINGIGTASAFGGVAREVESTLGLRNDFSGGEFRVFDTFNNDYDSATPVSEAQGWVAIHGAGATAKKVGLWRYDTTNYTSLMEFDTSNNVAFSGTINGRNVAADGTKLDGIESGATADLTGSEIKTLYEGEADTNAFTNALLTKLSNIEANATADENLAAANQTISTGTRLIDTGVTATLNIQSNGTNVMSVTGSNPQPTFPNGLELSVIATNANDAVRLGQLNATTGAAEIGYDNTTSGLTATEVQAALDEIVTSGGGSPLEVEDEGVSLSTSVTKINFVGDAIVATEPVANEITVTVNSSSLSTDNQNRINNENLFKFTNEINNEVPSGDDLEVSSGANIGKKTIMYADASESIIKTLDGSHLEGESMIFALKTDTAQIEVVPDDNNISLIMEGVTSNHNSLRIDTIGQMVTVMKTDVADEYIVSGSFTSFRTNFGAPPSTVTGVTRGYITDTTIDLVWEAATDDVAVTGYEYRIDGGTPVDVGNVLTTNITGRTAATSYSYEVRAYDGDGNFGAWSASVAFVQLPTGTEIHTELSSASGVSGNEANDPDPGGWFGFNANGTFSSVTDPQVGTYATQFQSNGTTNPVYFTYRFAATAADTYHVRFFAKTIDAANADIRSWGNVVTSPNNETLNTAWTEYSFDIEASATADVELRFYTAEASAEADDKFLIDNLNIIKTN